MKSNDIEAKIKEHELAIEELKRKISLPSPSSKELKELRDELEQLLDGELFTFKYSKWDLNITISVCLSTTYEGESKMDIAKISSDNKKINAFLNHLYNNIPDYEDFYNTIVDYNGLLDYIENRKERKAFDKKINDYYKKIKDMKIKYKDNFDFDDDVFASIG